MVGAPGVVMIAPGIGPRLDRDKAVASDPIRNTTPRAHEIWIDGRVMLIVGVNIASRRVGLPNFQQGIGHGTAVLVADHAGYDDPLPIRLTILGGQLGQIMIQGANGILAIDRPRQLGQGLGQYHQGLGRSPQRGRFILGIDLRRVAAPIPWRER